jgi:hypothetical protein
MIENFNMIGNYLCSLRIDLMGSEIRQLLTQGLYPLVLVVFGTSEVFDGWHLASIELGVSLVVFPLLLMTVIYFNEYEIVIFSSERWSQVSRQTIQLRSGGSTDKRDGFGFLALR